MKKLVSLILVTCLFSLLMVSCGDTETEEVSETPATEVSEISETEETDNTEYFDPFEGVSVEFTGASPNIIATMVISDNAMYDKSAYTMTRGSWDSDKTVTAYYEDGEPVGLAGLSDGDYVCVDVNEALTNVTTQQTGAVPIDLVATFMVKGQTSLIMQYNEIPTDEIDRLAMEGEEFIQNDINNEYYGETGIEYCGFTVTSAEYTGDNYFYINSDDSGNRLYFVYHLSLGYCTPGRYWSSQNIIESDFYCVRYMKNIMMDNEGNISWDISFYPPSPEYSMDEMMMYNDDFTLVVAEYQSSDLELYSCLPTMEDVRNHFTSVMDDMVLAGSTTSDS